MQEQVDLQRPFRAAGKRGSIRAAASCADLVPSAPVRRAPTLQPYGPASFRNKSATLGGADLQEVGTWRFAEGLMRSRTASHWIAIVLDFESSSRFDSDQRLIDQELEVLVCDTNTSKRARPP
jgi:hypothetical protein